VSGVPVVAGRATSPDALAPIDLRGLFDLVELDPRDRDGRRVAPHAFEAAGERRFVGVADGPLVVPKGVETLVLVLDGHEPEPVAVGEPPPGDGPRRVVMRSLRRVVLTVRSSFVLPPGQRLTVDLEPERLAGAAPATGTSPSMHAGARPYPGHQPDAAGRVEVPVARPGRYRVVVRVTTAAEIGAGYVPPIELPAEVCPVLEIGPVAAERPHEVVLPAVALRTASAALGGG
jgi:hypothetical protein